MQQTHIKITTLLTIISLFFLHAYEAFATSPESLPVEYALLKSIISFPPIILSAIIVGLYFHRRLVSIFYATINLIIISFTSIAFLIDKYFDQDPYLLSLIIITSLGLISFLVSIIADKLTKLNKLRKYINSINLWSKSLMFLLVFLTQVIAFVVIWFFLFFKISHSFLILIPLALIIWTLLNYYIYRHLNIKANKSNINKELIYSVEDFFYTLISVLILIIALLWLY